MNKAILIFFISCNALFVKGQIGTIYYSYIVKHDSLNENTLQLKILFNKEKSLEEILPLKQLADTGFRQIDENYALKNLVLPDNGKRPFVYKSFKENKLLFSEHFFFKIFFVEDTLNNFKWKITNEKKVILKFNCSKATTSFRGRNYIAWFADEIPIFNGPWKFCGLPGLIIKVNDDEEIFNYELTGLDLKTKIYETLITPPNVNNQKPVTHKQFLEAYEKTKRYLKNYSASQQTKNSTTSIKISEIKEKF